MLRTDLGRTRRLLYVVILAAAPEPVADGRGMSPTSNELFVLVS